MVFFYKPCHRLYKIVPQNFVQSECWILALRVQVSHRNWELLIFCQIIDLWTVFQKSNNYKIPVLRYGCLCVFICLGAYWGQTKQNWRLLCKYQWKKISSLNSWCNFFLKKVLIINRYSCLKIKNVAFNSLMSNL